MDEKPRTKPEGERTLTDSDFYTQACSYFYYHAGQRTTMINFFIAVFGALIALYGALISTHTLASMLIALFMGIASVIFFLIDLRNKFDVKKSENVIRQIEHDYGVDRAVGDYPYGVFSHETNSMRYYGLSERRQNKAAFRSVRALYRRVRKGKATPEQLQLAVNDYIGSDGTVSAAEVYQSLSAPTVVPLSLCIKMLYLLCMAISVFGFVFALILWIG